MQSICKQCNVPFETTSDDQSFYEELGVPSPKNCPDCRFMRRLTERNARILYRRTCDLSGREFISPYKPHQPFPVYHPDVWWSDQWDEMTYGQDIVFSKPFFPQFKELLDRVPHQGQFVIGGTMVNSEYVNCAGYLKDCYLIAEADHNEDCYYGNRIFFCKNVVDSSNCFECELCYECVDCLQQCYGLHFSDNCRNCSSSFFLRNCIGCKDCIGCINQRQKQYMMFNQQLTKEEFDKQKEALNMHSVSGTEAMRDRAEEFFAAQPQKAVQNENNENSTGNHLNDSKNSFSCFDCKDLEDCRWCARTFTVKSSRDYTSWGDTAELMYQCAACGDNAYHLRFCSTCTTNNTNLTYCAHCTGSSDCFGCVGLRKKKYCILNKQYSKEEYETLAEQLEKHMKESDEWGEFFPIDFCPFGYNETIAMEYFPLKKEEALKRGYRWQEAVDEPPQVSKIIPGKDLPETIQEVPDDVLNWAIKCTQTSRPFRIIKKELDFHRQQNLPLPRVHPDVRHARRIALRPNKLWDRTCSSCEKRMLSTFGPDRSERVLCAECYLKEVYE